MSSVTVVMPPVPDNQARTCQELQDKAKKGVLDKSGKHLTEANGKPLLGAVVVTNVGFATSPGSIELAKRDSSWRCNQDGSTAPTRAKCLAQCKKRGLSGPMIVDCLGQNTYTVRANATFSVQAEMYLLQVNSGCAAGQATNERIRRHEEQHLADIERRVDEWNGQRGQIELTVEATDLDEATKRAEDQVERESRQRASDLEKQTRRDSDTFHTTDQGGAIDLDCSCPPPGRTPRPTEPTGADPLR